MCSTIMCTYNWNIVVNTCVSDNADWSGVAKASELEWIPSYWDVIQLTSRVPSPEGRPIYSGFRVIETHVSYRIMHVYSCNLRFDTLSSTPGSMYVHVEYSAEHNYLSSLEYINTLRSSHSHVLDKTTSLSAACTVNGHQGSISATRESLRDAYLETICMSST